jgi:hypothetical protein
MVGVNSVSWVKDKGWTDKQTLVDLLITAHLTIYDQFCPLTIQFIPKHIK